MDHDGLQRWLDAYVAAWKSYDPDDIGALFSRDVVLREQPYGEPIVGRDAVVASWIEDRDPPGSYDARYVPVAIEGDIAVATGRSTYRDSGGKVVREYVNLFVLRFDSEDRCAESTEWYVVDPTAGGGEP